MTKLLRLSLPLAGLVFLGACASKLTIRQGPPVKAPVYAEGDSWVFRTTSADGSTRERRVTYKNGKFESDDPTFIDSILWKSVYLKDSKKKWLDFPLVPGKKWDTRFLYTSTRAGRTSMHDLQAVVVGPTPQPVQTASGKHEVTEIRAIDTYGRGGSINREFTYFYSSKTKSIVKMTADLYTRGGHRHQEAELIKYSVR